MKKYSGQTRIRIPVSLHRRLAEQAEFEGVSLNTYIIYLLSLGIESDQPQSSTMQTQGAIVIDEESTIISDQNSIILGSYIN